jgi:glutathione S-transferase
VDVTDFQPTATRIHHIALPQEWAAAFETGEYTRSTRDQSLAEVGFIHCSTSEQTESTANRFYADLDELVLLTIDPQRLSS